MSLSLCACSGVPVTEIDDTTAEDVVLYGTLTAIQYTVKFFDELTGAELFFAELSSYTISETDIALPAPADKDGYCTMGWYTADGNKMNNIPANHIGDVVLYAKYDIVYYTVTYREVTAEENDPRNVAEYQHGYVPTLYAPLNKDGYLFCGWYTLVNDEKVTVNSLEAFANQNIVLYAEWTEANVGGGDNDIITPDVSLGN